MSPAEAAGYVRLQQAAGRRVVFTNGVFDILHPGHVRYLREARALGDALIVGLNADASVRRNKGPERPINSEQDRAETLAGLLTPVRDHMRSAPPRSATPRRKASRSSRS